MSTSEPTRLPLRSDRSGWSSAGEGLLSWQLAPPDEQSPADTSWIRLEKGAELPGLAPGTTREILVLEGSGAVNGEPVSRGDYLRTRESFQSESSCLLFVKRAPSSGPDEPHVHARVSELPWLPGHGNLRVKPLHSGSTDGAALVHWPAGERFIPHSHHGGEEIVVLSGTFKDEHGEYPAGSWLQSPHMSHHHPYVDEETVIFVKTGHLSLSSSENRLYIPELPFTTEEAR